jgi:shikimate kinase
MESIFLAGPKHSGKTSAGRILASLCSCSFTDIDELIETRTGKSPRALYTESPELFRKAEAGAMAALIEADTGGRRVIAAGGGLVDNPGALALLEKSKTALLVHLEIAANTAWNRIMAASDGELPPFLQTENPRETHRLLHERRGAACRRLAGIIIKAEGKSPEEIALEILKNLPGGKA